MARSSIDEYNNNQRKREHSWFEKSVQTIVSTMAMSGLAISAWKMKGPFGKLVQRYEDDKILKYFNKGISKYLDRPLDKEFSDLTSSKLKVSKSLFDKMSAPLEEMPFTDEKGAMITSPDVRKSISGKENKILRTFSDVITGGENKLDVVGSVDDMGSRRARVDNQDIHSKISRAGPMPIAESEYMQFKSEINNATLARIRQQTIFEFLQTGTGVGKGDYAKIHEELQFYQSNEYFEGGRILTENKAIIERTTQLHEHLLKTEPAYAAMYDQALNPLVRRATLEPEALPSKLRKGPNAFRGFLYGDVIPAGSEIDNLIVQPHLTQLYQVDSISKQRHDFGLIDTITSGGKHSTTSTHRLLGQLGNVEYGSYIRRIINVLNNATEQNTGLQSFDVSISSYDYLDGERRFLVLNLQHENRGTPQKIEIPLETNGYIPTSSPSSSRKIGRFYNVEGVFSQSEKANLIRSTPFVLHEVANYIESTAFRSAHGSFKTHPEEGIKRLKSIVTKRLANHSLETGSIRDLVPMFSVTDPYLDELVAPGSNASAKLKVGYNNFVLNMHHMKSIYSSDKKAVVITIDLESLSNSKKGPEFMVNDNETQFVKGAVAVADMSNRTVLDGTEVSSTHGYKYFSKQGVGFGHDLQEWIRNHVIPNGEKIPPGKLEEAYADYLKRTGAKDFANNKQFFQALRNQIDAYINKYERQGYNVYFVTKNGTNFDLRAFRYHLGDDNWIRNIERKHIDIQATAGVLKKGYFAEGALSSEAMLEQMLNGLEQRELASQITRAHSMSPQARKEMVNKILDVFGTKGSAGVGSDAKLLNLPSMIRKNFEKAGLLEALHASPLLDALGTFGMFVSQYEQLKKNPMWDNAAGMISHYLRTGSAVDSAYNILGVLQQMTKKTYEGYGVLSTTALTHGMIHNMLGSFITMADINNMTDNPFNKQFNQLAAQEWNYKPSASWITKHGNVKTTDILYKRKFGNAFTTHTINEHLNQQLPKATDAANAYSKTAMMKGVVSLDFTAGGEDAGRILVKDTSLMDVDLTRTQVFDVSDEVVRGNVLLTENFARVRDATIRRMKEKGVDPSNATATQWEAISREVAGDTIVDLSEEVVGASKFNQLKIDKKAVQGKILAILKEPGPRGIINTKIKMELIMNGLTAGNLAAQARVAGERSTLQVVKSFSSGMAHGLLKGFDFAVHNKALQKAFVGATKENSLNYVLVELFDEYHKTKDANKKERIKAAIDKLKTKMNAEVDIDNYSVIFNRELTDELGSSRLMLSDIAEAAKKGGLIWTAKDIDEIENNAGLKATYESMSKSIEAHVKDLRQDVRSNNDCLKDLNRLATRDVFRHAEDFAKMIIPKLGEAKLAVVNNYSKVPLQHKYQLDVLTYSNQVLYGITNVFGNIRSNQRLEYIVSQRYNPDLVGEQALDWLSDYSTHKLSAVHRSAFNTMARFHNTLLGSQLFKPLNMDQLDFIINRNKHLNATSDAKDASVFKSMSPVEIQDSWKRYEELLKIAQENQDAEAIKHYTDLMEEASDLLDKKGAQEFLTDIRKSKRFFTYSEIEHWQNVAKENNGVLAFYTNNVHKIDIVQEARNFVGIIEGAHTMSAGDINQRAQVVIDALYKAKQAAGKKAPFNITKEGMLEMGSLLMPLDKNFENVFNKLGPNLFLATNETRIKMDLMEAINVLNKANVGKDPVAKADAVQKVNREYVRMLFLSFGMDKNSKLWESMQLAPPGLMPKHQGIETVKRAAIEELQRLNIGSELKDITYKGIAKEDALTYTTKVLQNIKKADIDTLLITESMFKRVANDRRVKTDVGVKFDGTRVNYLRELESSIGNEATKIRLGQRYLPGGIMARFPQTQSGGANLLASKYLVVPDEIAGYIGMNDNSFYAHSFLFSWLQGADSDGDTCALHFREINSIQDLAAREAENRKTLKAISDLPEVRDVVKRGNIKRDAAGNITKVTVNQANTVEGWTKDGKAIVSSVDFNSQGNLVTKMDFVDRQALDYSNFAKSVVELAEGVVRRTPGFYDMNEFMQQEVMKSKMPAFSKELIPASTNLLKKRMFQLAVGAEAGKIPGGARAMMDMTGGISHGLVGILGQLPIELAKHHKPEALASTVKVLDFFEDPTRNYRFREEVFQKYYEQYNNWAEKPAEKLVRDQFDREVTHFINMDAMEKIHPETRVLDRSIYNIMMGRQKATAWDYLYFANYDPSKEGPGSMRGAVNDMLGGLQYKVKFDMDSTATFRKFGKGAAVGAAILLGLSLFKPFSPSNSISPMDSFISLGDINSEHNLINSPLELPRGVPLDMVGASFSKEAYIKMNNTTNVKRQQAGGINNLLRYTRLGQPYDIYRVPIQPNYNYSNYTTSIPYMGTSDLQRRANL